MREAHIGQDVDVTDRLLEILFPLFAQIVVDRAFERGAVNERAAALVHERLQQELTNLHGNWALA